MFEVLDATAGGYRIVDEYNVDSAVWSPLSLLQHVILNSQSKDHSVVARVQADINQEATSFGEKR